MPALAAVIYLLLALRVRVSLNVSLNGTRGNVTIMTGAAGLFLRFDAEIGRKRKGILPAVRPRYGVSSIRKKEKNAKTLRKIRTYFRLARKGNMERLSLRARIGLDDAAETAIAAGCLRAAASTLFSCFGCAAAQELSVCPDFDNKGLCAQLHCIFSCQPGDIMLAAIMAAARKNRREGLGWKSIPLRA